MKCPCCKTELVEYKMLRLETLDEHICNPNGEISEKMAYTCPAPGCPVNAAKPTVKIFWNEYGERYSNYDTSTAEAYKQDREYFDGIPWVDGNDAPFGTFQRKINVEVYKTDENKTLFVVPQWFPIRKGWKCNMKWVYQSDEDGNILKRHWYMEWWIPNAIGHTLYISGFRMLKFELRSIWRNYVQILKGNDKWGVRNIESIIERSEWKNAEWWRKCGGFVARCVIGFVNLAKS